VRRLIPESTPEDLYKLISLSHHHYEIESEAQVERTPEVYSQQCLGLPTWSCCRNLHYWML